MKFSLKDVISKLLLKIGCSSPPNMKKTTEDILEQLYNLSSYIKSLLGRINKFLPHSCTTSITTCAVPHKFILEMIVP